MGLKSRAKVNSLKEESVTAIAALEEKHKALLEAVEKVNELSLLTEDELQRLHDLEVGEFFKTNMGAEGLLTVLKN